jgi:hypothetical protein
MNSVFVIEELGCVSCCSKPKTEAIGINTFVCSCCCELTSFLLTKVSLAGSLKNHEILFN